MNRITADEKEVGSTLPVRAILNVIEGDQGENGMRPESGRKGEQARQEKELKENGAKGERVRVTNNIENISEEGKCKQQYPGYQEQVRTKPAEPRTWKGHLICVETQKTKKYS